LVYWGGETVIRITHTERRARQRVGGKRGKRGGRERSKIPKRNQEACGKEGKSVILPFPAEKKKKGKEESRPPCAFEHNQGISIPGGGAHFKEKIFFHIGEGEKQKESQQPTIESHIRLCPRNRFNREGIRRRWREPVVRP